MIKVEIDIQPYCEKCKRWLPVIKKFDTSTLGGDYSSINTVQCEHKSECAEMYQYLKGQMQNE